jgi:BirA family biotin operon repressor/biotin-[acetyl-CoA-carboxylase] ligase
MIRAGAAPRRVGRRVILVHETTSTNDRALADGQDGTVALAEVQTAGRGRLGRRWHAPRGASILCSVAITGRRDDGYRRRLALVVPVAVCEAVAIVTDVRPSLSWPNDVYVGQRKLAGVLIESRPLWADEAVYAVGMGINCLQHASHFPPELRDRATSLELQTDRVVDRNEVARELLARLDAWLADDRFLDSRRLLLAWNEWSAMTGRRVCLSSEGKVYEGIAVEVDVDAGLVVQLDTGGRRFFDPDSTSVIEHVARETGVSGWRRRNHATASNAGETG